MQPSRSLLLSAAALHALLMWASFPPANLWPLILVAPAPLAWLAVYAPSTRFAVLTAVGAHVLLWFFVSLWLIEVTVIGFPFYVLAMAACNGGLFVWLFRRIHGAPSSTTLSWLPRLPMTVTLPVIWVGVEAVRGEVIVDGYPWYFLAHPIVEAPIIAQSADLFGAYFISFLVAAISGALLDLLRARVGAASFRYATVGLTAVLLIHLGNLAYGYGRINQLEALSEGPSMLVIQTNLPQDNKLRWTAEAKLRDFHEFMHLTIESFSEIFSKELPVDLIVWPETMLPGFGLEAETMEFLHSHDYFLEHYFASQMIEVAQTLDVPFLIGSPAVIGLGTERVRVEGDDALMWTWERQYNSAYLVAGDPPYQRYDKVFLTPFGETMPYFRLWPALEQRVLAVGARGMRFNLNPGEEMRTLDLDWRGAPVTLGTPICFESTIGWVNRRLVYHKGEKRADILVNLTNDGWFAWYGPGRVQHAQIARYRAIENRVPVIRSANTGVSVSIDSNGRLVSAIGEGSYGTPMRDGYLYTTVLVDSRRTLYGTIGDAWAWTCIALTALLLVGTWLKEK